MNAYDFLIKLTPTQQVGGMFVVLFGLLLLASLVSFLLSLRDHPDDDTALQQHRQQRNFQGILRTSWIMMIVFWVAWMAGEWVALWLFGLVSFFALREF